MKKNNYELIRNDVRDTSQAPKGKEIYYRCTECGGIIPDIVEGIPFGTEGVRMLAEGTCASGTGTGRLPVSGVMIGAYIFWISG